MRETRCLLALLLPLTAALIALPAAEDKTPDTGITWKKTVLDRAFRSEGVTVADVNKDGKPDILNGEVWYEAPDWKMHEIRKSRDYTEGNKNVYSNSFCCWTEDINGDGWLDLIVIPFPGKAAHWFENPKGNPGHWKQHEIWHSACNETPQYVDLLGTGKRVLLMGYQSKEKGKQGQMAYFTPGPDPTKPWIMHPISELGTAPTYQVTAKALEKLQTAKVDEEIVKKLGDLDGKVFGSPGELLAAAGKLLDKKALDSIKNKLPQATVVPGKYIPGTNQFDHGLGVGDVNGDGRLDVIVTGGWWEQPASPDGKTPWTFHATPIGGPCADMYAVDVDGDGKADIISSSAHGFGIWWHRQIAGKDGKLTFQTRAFYPKLVSQTHALIMADIDGDGLKDLVTGKRWWAHGPKGDADPTAPAMLYWFKAKKDKDGMLSYTPQVIDNDSGIGTQFAVADVNGDGMLDVVVSNKKGTFLFEQVRAKSK
jgi:hypothetical protein